MTTPTKEEALDYLEASESMWHSSPAAGALCDGDVAVTITRVAVDDRHCLIASLTGVINDRYDFALREGHLTVSDMTTGRPGDTTRYTDMETAQKLEALWQQAENPEHVYYRMITQEEVAGQ